MWETPLGKSLHCLTFVLFNVVKIHRNDDFSRNGASKTHGRRAAAGLSGRLSHSVYIDAFMP